MTAFGEYDLRVFEAHSLAEQAGGATFPEMRRHHPGPLPVQRLIGLARRGLIRRDGEEWFLTREGVRQANAYRDGLASQGERP